MIYFQSAVILVHILSLVQSQPNHGHHHHNNYLQDAMDHWIKFKVDKAHTRTYYTRQFLERSHEAIQPSRRPTQIQYFQRKLENN